MATVEMTSREDTFDMLADYPREAVERALEELGCDINASEFPTTIVEDVLGMIDGLQLAQQKVLAAKPQESPREVPQTPEEEALVVREMTSVAGELLHSSNTNINPRTLAVVAQAFVAGGRHKAEVLLRLQEKSFVDTLQQGQKQFETNLVKAVIEQQKSTEKLFSEENIHKMVERGTVRHDNEGFDADLLLDECRQIIQGQNQRQFERKTNVQVLTDVQEEFSVDAFLDEILGG